MDLEQIKNTFDIYFTPMCDAEAKWWDTKNHGRVLVVTIQGRDVEILEDGEVLGSGGMCGSNCKAVEQVALPIAKAA